MSSRKASTLDRDETIAGVRAVRAGHARAAAFNANRVSERQAA